MRNLLKKVLITFAFAIVIQGVTNVNVDAAEVKKVTRLTVHNGDNKNLLLQWRKQEGAGYVIYRSEKKKTGYKKAGTLKNSYWADVDYEYVQWVDTKVKKNHKYYYKVKAYQYIDGNKVHGDFSKVKGSTVKATSKVSLCYDALPIINKERSKEGLRRVLWDFKADNGAIVRAKEISKEFDHTRPNGKDCLSAYKGANTCSENIGYGYISVKSCIYAWLNSVGHRGWILCGYTEDIVAGKYGLMYGKNYDKSLEPGEVLPGDVCGISVTTYKSYYDYVFTKIVDNLYS
ncbi:MAG: hypothetical protein K6G88_11100 [Lachnospiraceae bacterium]|nr:hypothetical protein [Lachnospiraceae bacterium]